MSVLERVKLDMAILQFMKETGCDRLSLANVSLKFGDHDIKALGNRLDDLAELGYLKRETLRGVPAYSAVKPIPIGIQDEPIVQFLYAHDYQCTASTLSLKFGDDGLDALQKRLDDLTARGYLKRVLLPGVPVYSVVPTSPPQPRQPAGPPSNMKARFNATVQARVDYLARPVNKSETPEAVTTKINIKALFRSAELNLMGILEKYRADWYLGPRPLVATHSQEKAMPGDEVPVRKLFVDLGKQLELLLSYNTPEYVRTHARSLFLKTKQQQQQVSTIG